VLRVGTLGLGTNLECKVVSTGEWSDDMSELDSAQWVCAGILRTTAKSMRSGIFGLAGPVGWLACGYMGEVGRLHSAEQLSSSRRG